MFGIGSTEFLVIIIVALLVLGPEHLPKIMRTVGKTVGEFRRLSTEFQRTINTEVAFDEEKQKKQEAKAQKKKEAAANAANEEAKLKADQSADNLASKTPDQSQNIKETTGDA